MCHTTQTFLLCCHVPTGVIILAKSVLILIRLNHRGERLIHTLQPYSTLQNPVLTANLTTLHPYLVGS